VKKILSTVLTLGLTFIQFNIQAVALRYSFDPNQIVGSSFGEPPCAGCEMLIEAAGSRAVTLPTNPRSARDTTYFNRDCRSFLQDNGSYGPWGNEIVRYIDEVGGANSRFLSDALPGMQSIPRTCPNWGRLSTDERKLFWVWTVASMAQVESSCDPSKVNTGRVPNPNDRPRGLLQLNSLRSERSWRGRNCRFPSNDTAPVNQIRCGMDIMDELLKGRSGEYRSNGKIFPTNSYWEKFRPNHSQTGGPIGQLIRRFPLCGASESTPI